MIGRIWGQVQGVSELLADCDKAIEYGDLDFAGHGLLKVLSQDPTNHEAWTTLARFLIDAGKALMLTR